MTEKSFEELLVEGALNAVRTLSLEELYQQQGYLLEMNLPDEIAAFPAMILAYVIEEKQNQRVMN